MSKKNEDQEFHEALPMYMHGTRFETEEVGAQVGPKILRQLGLLLGLLILQIVLFAVLIQSTINL